MHKSYRDLIENRAVQVVGAAKALQSVSHNGFKGTLRELIVRDLLLPFIPPRFAIGTGEIISAEGKTSGQTDIIIYDRSIVPPLLLDPTNGIFPIEAVVATVEVKSTLNVKQLRQAHQAAREVEQFVHAPPFGHLSQPKGDKIEHVIPFIFAFDTDLASSGKDDLERYKKIYLLNGTRPALRGLCVVDRGFWSFGGEVWHECSCSCKQGAIVAMVAAIINCCQRVANTRRQPDILDYIENRFP